MSQPEELVTLLEELNQQGISVIVEGRKDQKALQELGIDGKRIITCTKPSYKIIELLLQHKVEEVAILTDLDRQGKKLYHRLQSDCIRWGIKINNKLRLYLLQETPLQHLEGLDTYIGNLQKKMGPKGFEPLIPTVLSIAMLVAQQSCACEGDVIYGQRKSR